MASGDVVGARRLVPAVADRLDRVAARVWRLQQPGAESFVGWGERTQGTGLRDDLPENQRVYAASFVHACRVQQLVAVVPMIVFLASRLQPSVSDRQTEQVRPTSAPSPRYVSTMATAGKPAHPTLNTLETGVSTTADAGPGLPRISPSAVKRGPVRRWPGAHRRVSMPGPPVPEGASRSTSRPMITPSASSTRSLMSPNTWSNTQPSSTTIWRWAATASQPRQHRR